LAKKLLSYVFVIFLVLVILAITLPNDAGSNVVEKGSPEKMQEWFSNHENLLPWR